MLKVNLIRTLLIDPGHIPGQAFDGRGRGGALHEDEEGIFGIADPYDEMSGEYGVGCGQGDGSYPGDGHLIGAGDAKSCNGIGDGSETDYTDMIYL